MGFVDHTAFERMHKAIDSLAVSTAPIQQRVENAGLQILPLGEQAFRAGDERELYVGIMSALSTQQDDELGSLVASARALDDESALGVAENLMHLYFSVIDGVESSP
jgi:hypothetical protein